MLLLLYRGELMRGGKRREAARWRCGDAPSRVSTRSLCKLARSVALSQLWSLFAQGKFHIHAVSSRDADRLAPDHGIREKRPLHADLSGQILDRHFAHHSP